jgi:hypothetical protein
VAVTKAVERRDAGDDNWMRETLAELGVSDGVDNDAVTGVEADDCGGGGVDW